MNCFFVNLVEKHEENYKTPEHAKISAASHNHSSLLPFNVKSCASVAAYVYSRVVGCV